MTQNLPISVASRNTVIYDKFIYVIGGRSPSATPIAEVYRSRIDNGVLLSNWSLVTSLPEALYSQATIVIKDYLYLIGGWDGSNARTEIQRAAISVDGQLGAWSKVGDFPIRIQTHEVVRLNNYLYVIGGADNSKPVKTVYFTTISDDGDLGVWRPTSSLPHNLYLHAAVAYGNALYTVGGYDGSQPRNEIYRAVAAADGSLGGWVAISQLPNPRFYSAALVRNDELWVIGGATNTTAFNEVWSTPFTPAGTLGSWQAQPALPEPRYRFGAVLGVLGQIYVIGGLRTNSNTRNEVYVLAEPANVACHLSGQPAGWLAPGTQVEYAIRCRVGPTFPVDNLVITNDVPAPLNLAPASIQGNHEVNGRQITWRLGAQAAGATINIGYRTQRPSLPAPTSPTPSASGLTLTKMAEPAYTATAGQTITYTLRMVNQNATAISGTFVLSDELPVGVTAALIMTESITATTSGLLNSAPITGSFLPSPINRIEWLIPEITLAPQERITASFALRAPAKTLINRTYGVRSLDGLYYTSGDRPVVIYAGAEKDGFLVVNAGAFAIWQATGQNFGPISSNTIIHGPFSSFLPIARR